MSNETTMGRREMLLRTGSLAAAGAAIGGPAAAQASGSDPLWRDGAALLERLGDPDALLTSQYSALSADLVGLHVRTVYGGILSRPGLTLQQRMIVSLAATATVANVADDLETGISGALAVGVTPREIVETFIQLGPEVGFPAAQDALFLARDVFRSRQLGADLDAPNRPAGEPRDMGLATLATLGTPEHADALGGLGNLGDDLDRLTAAFAYGEIFNRPGLDPRTRCLVALTAMIARGNRHDALAARVDMARRAGVTPTEMSELLIQMSTHVGWSEALDAASVFQTVLSRPPAPIDTGRFSPSQLAQPDPAEIERETRRGLGALATLTGLDRDGARRLFEGVAPDVGDYFVDFSYGAVFSRPGLSLKTRELATLAAMVGLGSANSETPLRLHVIGALECGASHEEITETIFHMLPYVGFPAVRHALVTVAGVFAERRSAGQDIDDGLAASRVVTIVARLRARPGQEAALREALLEVVRESRLEAGCLEFDMHVSRDDPALFIAFERWADDEALQAHMQSPHFLAIVARSETLLAEPMDASFGHQII